MKRLVMACVVVGLVAGLSSVGVSSDEWMQWTGAEDSEWNNPNNWVLWEIDPDPPGPPVPIGIGPPGPDTQVTIDENTLDDWLVNDFSTPVPNVPVIHAGNVGPNTARAGGIATAFGGSAEPYPGTPTLYQVGGVLDVSTWIWWGDGYESIGDWYMIDGIMNCPNDAVELGWHGGGKLTHQAGWMRGGRLYVPTSSGSEGSYKAYGGQFNVVGNDRFRINNQYGQVDLGGGMIRFRDDIAPGNPGSAYDRVQTYIGTNQLLGYGGTATVKFKYHPATKSSYAYTTVWAVPEPATLSLLASLLVLGGVAWLYRRR
jgi:hypothetical protein